MMTKKIRVLYVDDETTLIEIFKNLDLQDLS
jgi:hypothetical protein